MSFFGIKLYNVISLCTLPKAILISSTGNNKTLHNVLHQFTKNFKSKKIYKAKISMANINIFTSQAFFFI